jgi:hypothetical protein
LEDDMSMQMRGRPGTLAALDAYRERERPKFWERLKDPARLVDVTVGPELLALVLEAMPIGATLRDLAEARYLALAVRQMMSRGGARSPKAALALVMRSTGWRKYQDDLNMARSCFSAKLGDHSWIPGGCFDFNTAPRKVREFADSVRGYYQEQRARFLPPTN